MRDLLTVLKEMDDYPAKMQEAAKKLCVRRGHDPLECVQLMQFNDGSGRTELLERPRWMDVYDELQEAATTLLCLTEE